MTQPAQQRMLDAPELNTDQAFLMCQDFVTEVVTGFLPEALQWCERGPGMDLPPGVWDKIKDEVGAGDKTIFDAIKASNFYPEVSKSFYPDLAIGTVAMWIERPHPHRAIVASAIPLRELEINLGPYGEVDDRFAVRYTRNCYVHELVGDEIWAKMDGELKKVLEEKGSERTQVAWGFWRDWDDKTDEVWQHVVLVDCHLVHDAKLKGEGCCPLIVARFNPTADWPHGQGPMMQALPTFRQIDELESMRIENAELALVPPITYPDDSFAAIEQGLEPRMAYPVRPGSEKAVQNIYDAPPPNVANFQYEEKIHSLRKLFFVDLPEQTGDTPPTATQWMDELARTQRRIGTPGLPFWFEFCAASFTRFKYLLEAAGKIAPLKSDGRAIATLPRNPTQAAADMQEVATAMKAAQFCAAIFPEEFKLHTDGAATMKAFLDKMRVTLLKSRDPKQVEAALKQIAQLASNQAPQAPSAAPGAMQ